MAKAEKFILEDFCLKDVFKEEFIKKVESIGENVFPVTIVFVNETGEENTKSAFPIVFSHQNKGEVDNKIAHIESPNTDAVNNITKLLEEKDGE